MGLRVNIVGNHLVARIDAAGQEDAGLAAVQIRGAEEVLRGTMAVAVAPGLVHITLAIFQQLQGIGQTLVHLTRLAIHI